jgi:soluble lytic murein transglycosylase
MLELAPVTENRQVQINADLLKNSSRFALGVELVRLGLTSRGKKIIKEALSTPDAKPVLHRVAASLFRNMGQFAAAKELSTMTSDEWKGRYPVGKDFTNWTLAYPQAFEDDVNNASLQSGITPALLYAVMREESGFNEKIESWANAIGLMQLVLPTAKAMGKTLGMKKVTRKDLRIPATNVALGAAYLSYLKGLFNSNPALMISGYNAGEGAVARWKKDRQDMELDLFIENIPYSQTRGYTKRVLSSYAVYSFLYGENRPVVTLNMSID